MTRFFFVDSLSPFLLYSHGILRLLCMKNSKYVRSLVYKFRTSQKKKESLSFLFDIVDYYANHNNTNAWKYCEIALEISKSLDETLRIRTLLMACSIAQYLGDNEKVSSFIEECRAIAGISYNKEYLSAIIDLFFAVREGRKANIPQLIELCSTIIPIVELQGTPRELCTLYHSLGLAHSFLGEHDTALTYLQQAFAIAEQSSLLTQQLRTRYSILEIRFRLGDNQYVIEETKAMLKEITEHELIAFEGRCRLFRGRTYFHIGQYENSIEELTKALNIFQKAGDIQGEYYAAINLASSYREVGFLSESVAQLLPLLQLQDEMWWEVRYHAYQLLGTIFITTGDAERAIQLFYHALAQLHNVTNNLEFFTAPLYGNIGYAYLLTKRYDEAELYLQKVLSIFTDSSYNKHIVSALQNIGALHIQRNDYEIALECIKKSLNISRQIQHKFGILNSLILLAELYNRQSHFEKAIEVVQEVFDITLNFPSLRSEMYAHKSLALAFEELGNGSKALFHLKQYNILHDKFWSHDVAAGIYDVFRVIDSITHEKAHNSVALQKEHLEIEIRQKHQELRSMALQLTQRNQILHTVKKEVEKINESKIKKKKKSLPKELLTSVRTIETGWQTFFTGFHAVHAGFYEKLPSLFPMLTEAEVRVCCLMKVDLSTKQIAEILCVSPRTVETHRLRIRKKILNGRTEDLRKYLIHLEIHG